MDSEENNWTTSLDLSLEALVESFESGDFSDLEWTLDGNADWSIDSQQYFEGGYSDYEENRKKRLGDKGPQRIKYKKLVK